MTLSSKYKKRVFKLLTLSFFLAIVFQAQSCTESNKSLSAREVIGRWRDDSPQISSTVELYRQNGRYYLDYRFDKDGSKATQELTSEEGKKGTQQFRRLGHPSDYYVITQDNSLESKDNQGIIFTARPIEMPVQRVTSKTLGDTTKVPVSGKGEGFRDISWGTDISTLNNMELFHAFDGNSYVIASKTYTRRGDNNKIGDANVSIHYSFWNNKLYEATIHWESGSWESLVQTIFEKYGKHKFKVEKGYRRHEKTAAWTHGKTKIVISESYSLNSDESIAAIFAYVNLSSVDMEKQQDAYLQQAKKQERDKENAAKQQEESLLKKRAKAAAKKDL